MSNDKDKCVKKSKRGLMSLDGALLKEMVNRGAEELRSNIDEVNRLNVFPVPDGDTGDNMFSTVRSGVKAIEGLDTDNLAEMMHVLSHGMLLGARGNSGVILSQFFKGVADGFENAKSATPKALAAALEVGVKEAYSTVMTPTEGTILTVAREAVEYAVSKINPKTTIRSFFNDFVKELHESVKRTPESLPALKEAGVVDSGGAGLFYLMDGFNRVLRGEKIDAARAKEKEDEFQSKEAEKNDNDINKEKAEQTSRSYETKENRFDENTDMEFAYCTELLVQLTHAKCDTDSFDTQALKDFLSSLGDSVATVKSGSVIKIHVHTLKPDKVLSYMLGFGEFINVKIENMSLQHNEIIMNKTENTSKSKELFTESNSKESSNAFSSFTSEKADKKAKKKKYGVVAVSCGEGIDGVFKELGASETINVKGTENPSANDFLESAARTGAEEVFLFPNNSNFILSAEQAAKMADGFNIHVIHSKNIALGYSALSVISLDTESTEEIIRTASKTLNNAISGCVFTAARDTKCSGLKIKYGDTVGCVGKDIVAKAKNSVECSLKICKRLLSDRFVLTIFKGEGAKESEALIIEKRIKKICPKAEIYSIDSGQDIFEYMFCAE